MCHCQNLLDVYTNCPQPLTCDISMANSPYSAALSSATDPSSKCQNLSNEGAKLNNTIDRISSLPDSLLFHILSFLPTKISVATSILSTRWRYLWTWVPILDFNDGSDGDRVGNLSFVHFVYRVLVLHKSSCTKKFRLKCGGICDSFHFNAWVCAAIMCDNIEELDLYMSSDQQPVESPRSLFTCKVLKVLKLSGGIVLNVPPAVYFPVLKVLHLVLIKNLNDDTTQKLFSGCPLLEDLLIKRSASDNVQILSIFSPSLKKLTIQSGRLIAKKLEINCPALELLNLKGNLRDSLVIDLSIENLSNLVEANVDVGRLLLRANRQSLLELIFLLRVSNLLKGLSNVKYLSLSGITMKSLGKLSKYYLPMFHNLTKLEVGLKCCEWHMLPNFLERSHNLEVLSLNKSARHRNGHESCWRQPQHVPMCLSLKLTTIDFQGFEGSKDEKKLVKYILKNAEVLRTMNISCKCKFGRKVSSSPEIIECPRASKTCQVVFC